MKFLILLFFIIITALSLLIGNTYISYRITFAAPKHFEDEDFKVPDGRKCKKKHARISQYVNEMLIRPFEPVTITSHDGLILYARYYHVADNAPLQIQFHGYKSSAIVDFCNGSRLAGNLGHNALVVDQRSHGKSEGKCITFGIMERRDCLSWIEYALKRFGKDTKIILAGLSMGAATVLMATDQPLPTNVMGIMADCPFSSPKDIIKKVCWDMYLPAGFMYPIIKLGARLFGHFDLEECSAVSSVQNAHIPILLIHGKKDRFVPCNMSQKIAEACASPVTFVAIENAGHGLSYQAAPKQYEEVTVSFLKSILQ